MVDQLGRGGDRLRHDATGRADDVRKELERSFEPDPPEVLVAPEGWS